MKQKKNRTFGLLFSGLFDNYEMMLWKGASEAVLQKGQQLICYAGGALDSPYYYRNMRNILYDQIALDKLDGLIILTAAVSNHVSLGILKERFSAFKDFPQVHVGFALPGHPSIRVDNRKGMGELINHFICEHNCRKIAFLRGPATSTEAQDRFKAYMEILKQHHIPYNPDYVVEGDFHPFSAEQAVTLLFDQRKVEVDALVCANDYTATWALHELGKRGIQVPRDLLLGGFDDVFLARSSSPALTAVRQPLIQMGRQAVDLLTDLLDGKFPDFDQAIPTQLIIRESCGCNRSSWLMNQEAFDQNEEQTLPERVYEILSNQFPFLNGIRNELIVPLFTALEKMEQDYFISHIADLIDEDILQEKNLSDRNNQVHLLFSLFYEAEKDKARQKFLMKLWNRCSLLISHYIEEHVTFLRYQSEEHSLTFHRLSQGIISALTLDQLEAAVKKGFPRLGIERFWVVLYDEPSGALFETAHILFSHKQNATDASASFPVKSLLPDDCLKGKKSNLMVYALYFKEERYGYVVLDNLGLNSSIYESIPILISGVLKSLSLNASVQEYANELEARVEKRTKDLTFLNETLLKEVRERQKITEQLEHKNREVERLYRELQVKSKQDYLTNLYNRAAILGLLENEHRRAQRQQRRNQSAADDKGIFTVMMLDLDHFKRINDTYGHLAGDEVLRKLGEILTHEGILRQEDLAGRYGGEEFIVVLPETSAEQAMLPATRLADTIRELEFSEHAQPPFRVTVSIGISQFCSEDENIEDLIQRADKALYQAKNQGRDRIAVYSQPE